MICLEYKIQNTKYKIQNTKYKISHIIKSPTNKHGS